jgi:gluconolactonase
MRAVSDRARRFLVVAALVLLAGVLAVGARAAWKRYRSRPAPVVRTGALAAADATPILRAGGLGFAEGPALDARGDLYFTDIPANRIHRLREGGPLETFREGSGGANGLVFDAAGRLLACEGERGRVTATDAAGNVTVVADLYDGRRFNKPNDLWVDAAGGVYFTDPAYGLPVVQDGEHVYYVRPGGAGVTRVAADLARPNGVTGSPDGRILYVADEKGRAVYAYDVAPDGTLSGRRLFAPVRGDGIKTDARGNLWVAADAVRVYDPSGREVDAIPLPERPTNLCFAGTDLRTLYVTAPHAVYAVRVKVPGAMRSRRP